MMFVKKTISTILVLILIVGAFPMVSPDAFSVFAEDDTESGIEEMLSFSQEANSLLEEYAEPYFEDRVLSEDEVPVVAECIEATDSITDALILYDEMTEDPDSAPGSATAPSNSASAPSDSASGASDATDIENDIAYVVDAAEKSGLSVTVTEDNSISISSPYQTKQLFVKANKAPTSETAVDIISGPDDVYILQYDTIEDVMAAEEELNEDRKISYAIPVPVMSACETGSHMSWGYGEDYLDQDNYLSWLTAEVDDLQTVTVAVIDSGVDYNHEYLRGRVDTDNDYDFVDNDDDAMDEHFHGTHVAGTIIDGTPSNVRILPLRVLGADGYGSSVGIYTAIAYAIKMNVDVINMSLGGSCEYPFYDEVINKAVEKGIIVCVAAGNSCYDAKNYSPANSENAITVAALDSNKERAYYSNYGKLVDVAAPGSGIYSCLPSDESNPNGRYGLLSGTSMASPHVAAVAACLKSYDSSINTDEMLKYLKKTAVSVKFGYEYQTVGMGMVCMKNIISENASALTLLCTEKTMYKDMQFRIGAYSYPKTELVWSTSDEAVATVENGLVTANGNGSCDISVAANGETRKCHITVEDIEFSVSDERTSFYVGESYALKYDISIIDAPIEWSVDNPEIITVDENGTIQGESIGSCVLSITVAKGTVSEISETMNISVIDFGAWYKNATDNYMISDESELYEFAFIVSKGLDSFSGRNVEINPDTEEISLSEFDSWLPIGNSSNSFRGNFDGHFVPVRDLVIKEKKSGSYGLFGMISNARIENVVVENADIAAPGKIGIIVGDAVFSSIRNCHTDGYMKISGSDTKAGGIVGNAYGKVRISNCENFAEIYRSAGLVGGIAGLVKASSRIVNCINYGTISHWDRIGGLVGYIVQDGVANASECSALINSVNVGNVRNAVAFQSTDSIVDKVYYAEERSTRSIEYIFAQDDKSVPKTYKFDSELKLTAYDISLIDSLNSYVAEYNSSNDELLYSWAEKDGLPVLAKNVNTEGVFWFEEDNIYLLTGCSYETALNGLSEGQKPVYSSTDESIAVVDENGVITGLSDGTVQIYAECNGFRVRMTAIIQDIGEWYRNSDSGEYILSTVEDLLEFREVVNSGKDSFKGKTVSLAADIDMSNQGYWIPIGNTKSGYYFYGTFNGNNHSISNLIISSGNPLGNNTNQLGLFSYLPGGNVKNVILKDMQVYMWACEKFGGIAAVTANGVSVMNCITSGNCWITSQQLLVNSYFAGGLVGYSEGNIINCSNNISFFADNQLIGGIAGYCGHFQRRIINCVNNGNFYVRNNGNVAGIVKDVCGAYVENCTNNGNIIRTTASENSKVAFSGICDFLRVVEVRNCINNGKITGSTGSGTASGILNNPSGTLRVDNSVNTGDISIDVDKYAIGFVNKTTTLNNVFWLDGSAEETHHAVDAQGPVNNLQSFNSDYILSDETDLVTVLNQRVEEYNEDAQSDRYLNWEIDDCGNLAIDYNCTHDVTGYIYGCPSSCQFDTERVYSCLRCGKALGETQKVEQIEHVAAYVKKSGGSCISPLITKAFCMFCGEMFSEEKTVIPHTPGDEYFIIKEPTCTKIGLAKKKCTSCKGYLDETVVVLPRIPHTPEKDYSVVVEPTCTTDGYKIKRCVICNNCVEDSKVILPAPGHEEYLSEHKDPTCFDIGYDRYDCKNCKTYIRGVKYPELEHVTEEKITSPTCTSTGVRHTVCSVCNRTISVEIIPKLEHDYIITRNRIEPTCTGIGKEAVYTCSLCHRSMGGNVLAVLPHTEEKIPAVPATCVKTGLSEGSKCSVCNTVITQQTTTPATGHNYVSTITNPTCITWGKTTHTCSYCGDYYFDSYTPYLGHDLTILSVRVNPTCTTDGKQAVYQCSRCNATPGGEVIKATGHTVVTDKAVAATCAEYGRTEGSRCSVCNTVFIEPTLIPKTDHTVVIDKAVASTCTEEGRTEGSRCSVCNTVFKKQFAIARHGHNYVSTKTYQTCTTKGYTTHTCSYCGDSYVDSHTDALGHNFTVLMSAKVNPTCTTDGKQAVYQCIRCTDTSGGEVIKTTGHNYVSTTTDPTCLTRGYTTHKCSACGDSIVDSYTDAFGHDFTILKSAKVNPTCTTNGKQTVYQCSRCTATRGGEVIKATGHTVVTDKGLAATCTTDGITEGRRCTVCNTVIVSQEIIEKTGHSDSNNDNYCDYCGETLITEDPSDNCTCSCHNSGFARFIFRIKLLFWKMLKTNQVCACGKNHY